MTNKTALIGIGGAGCKIVYGIQTKNKRFYIDTDTDVIDKYSGLRIGARAKVCEPQYVCGIAYILR